MSTVWLGYRRVTRAVPVAIEYNNLTVAGNCSRITITVVELWLRYSDHELALQVWRTVVTCTSEGRRSGTAGSGPTTPHSMDTPTGLMVRELLIVYSYDGATVSEADLIALVVH